MEDPSILDDGRIATDDVEARAEREQPEAGEGAVAGGVPRADLGHRPGRGFGSSGLVVFRNLGVLVDDVGDRSVRGEVDRAGRAVVDLVDKSFGVGVDVAGGSHIVLIAHVCRISGSM